MTGNGAGCSTFEPSPSWLWLFTPQHSTAPLRRRAQLCAPPTEMPTASSIERASTGARRISARPHRAVADRAELVAPPARDATRAAQRADVQVAGRHLDRVGDPRHQRRPRAVVARRRRRAGPCSCCPSTTLARRCRTPQMKPALLLRSGFFLPAWVLLAIATLTMPSAPGHRRGRRARVGTVVAELAAVVGAPAEQAPVGRGHAGVRAAGEDPLRPAAGPRPAPAPPHRSTARGRAGRSRWRPSS